MTSFFCRFCSVASFALISIFLSSAQAATNSITGTVASFTQNTQATGGNPSNIAYVVINGTYNGTHPSCATVINSLAFDPTSVAGQNAFRSLMAAKLSGSSVTSYTTGACSVGGIVEDILQFLF